MTAYSDPLTQKLFDLIDASDGGAIISYYHGDPFMIPRSDLPALIGVKDATEVRDNSVAEDQHEVRIVLTLVTDVRNDFGDTAGVVAGWQTLYDIFEGRNADYTLKSTSIMDILRSNSELNNQAHIDTTVPMVVNYGFTLGKRGENSISLEASLSVPIYFTQVR